MIRERCYESKVEEDHIVHVRVSALWEPKDEPSHMHEGESLMNNFAHGPTLSNLVLLFSINQI